ncbi:SGNH/GDSL hydrolase family protein [Arthrobacter sp. 35W]|uniref:SGNH/GDSL hydrolase family protein n=1 Tax=Arthrobacter sp. 35W TaxID=1132441 RepID=UPI00041B7FFD|nr:SGNH/GDSL hydrolase family protein [Arthrobacter sp. 35W]
MKSTVLVLAAAGALVLAGCSSSASTVSPGGLPVGPSPGPAAAPSADSLLSTVVVLGDSLSTGYGTSPELAWPALLQDDFDTRGAAVQIINAARNGSGYVSIGDDDETFVDEAAEIPSDTSLVVVFGSENDMGYDDGELREAAAQTYAGIKAAAPTAAVVVVGPPSYTDDPEPERLQVRDAVASEAQAAGVAFVDPIAEHWIMGRADELIGPDGDHPSEAGQYYLAGLFDSMVSARLPAPVAG